MMRLKLPLYMLFSFLLAGCIKNPVGDINNICNVFIAHPQWYVDTLNVQKRWLVPISVQMAIIYQETKFDASPHPQHSNLLWLTPWVSPSNLYGYSPELRHNWELYKHSQGGNVFCTHFADRVDFIGWYANFASVSAGIKGSDAYSLYLAYHEGAKGYVCKTFLNKGCLVPAARRVSVLAKIYQSQLRACHR